MALTLELTPEVEQALEAFAQAMGNTPGNCAVEILESHLAVVILLLGHTKRDALSTETQTETAHKDLLVKQRA